MAKGIGIHVVTNTRLYKGRVYRSHLLRRSFREGDKVRKETIANLTPLGDEFVEGIRSLLRGGSVARAEDLFTIDSSAIHGPTKAVLLAMERLAFDSLLGGRASRMRRIAQALVASRVIEPHSKIATTRWWRSTTLLVELGLTDVTEDEVYAAMDWLLERQSAIEKKLAARHFDSDSLVLCDMTSSYFEGSHCPLAKRGHNRDGKKGTLQVNYGLLTDSRGCPVSVTAFDGNTADSKTLIPFVENVRQAFGIKEFVIVGDRGMITQKQINVLKDLEDVSWITALRTEGVRKLLKSEVVNLQEIDEQLICEIRHPDYPGERLIVCRNDDLAKRRSESRQSLLESTTLILQKIQESVQKGRLQGKDKIGLRVGRNINQFKMAKHFVLDIQDGHFSFQIDDAKVAAEAALDGLYVVRTPLTADQMDSASVVRSYKRLAMIERGFRAFKSMDLQVRPIYHRLEKRVKAHLFLCLLAYYVQWHMIEAWRELLFCDEDQEAKETRHPVNPAKRSSSADKKASTKRTADGNDCHSFRTLLMELNTIVRNQCRRLGASSSEQAFALDTTPNATQQRALERISRIAL